MHICVFEMGQINDQLQATFHNYPDMIRDWLLPYLPTAKFSKVSIIQGEKAPSPSEYDAYIISGSKHGVYDPIDWIPDVENFLRLLPKFNKPVFGICFGHQIIAQAWGGRVEKYAKGWSIGAQTYRANDLESGFPDQRSFHVFHQDQVLEAPQYARNIAGSNFCPIGALKYDFPAMSVQFHPEFSREYTEALITMHQGQLLPHEVAQQGLNSLGQKNGAAQIGKMVADFFLTNT